MRLERRRQWPRQARSWAAFSKNWRYLYDAGCVLIRRPPPNARRYAALALKTLIRYRGHVEPHGKMGLIYRSLSMIDMMHALTARGYGADNFCTRDRQFAALAGDPEFRAIDFVVF